MKRDGVCRFLSAILVCAGIIGCSRSTESVSTNQATHASDSFYYATVKRSNWMKSMRISGIVSAVKSRTIVAPRLSGQMGSNMVLTQIVRSGVHVQAGDILAEFDRQTQQRNILDKQAEYDNLVQQIRKKQADLQSARAADETDLKSAEVDVRTAKVEIRKNSVVPSFQAEINKVNLEESEARLKQLKDTFNLRREAEAAELRILEIQRDRAKLAADYAQSNTEKMTIHSPLDGLAVLSKIWKGSRRVDPQEGDEYRSGSAIMTVVDTEHMQVSANVNQTDIAQIYIGQPAVIRLDAYPDLVFPGKVEQISTVGTPGEYSKRIRLFSVLISIQGSNAKLLPDLTASAELQIETRARALLLPREAVYLRNGQPMVEVLKNGRPMPAVVKTGPVNDMDVVVESGLQEGDRVVRAPEM